MIEKLEEAKVLARKLERSISLEEALPDIFNDGAVTTAIVSQGIQGQPMLRITKAHSIMETPLIKAGDKLIHHYRNIILNMRNRVGYHSDWNKLFKKVSQ